MTDLWHWHTDTEHPYLTTPLLEKFSHGFFTRLSWPTTTAELSHQLDPDARAFRAKQVHGKRVVTPGDFSVLPEDGDALPEADAVMTLMPQQAAWVCTADCTPVLIADSLTGQVAAVHAGWRGTALGIVPETIRQMRVMGSQLEHLRVALGPAIAGSVYQVTRSVALEVSRSLSQILALPEDVIAHLQSLQPPPVLPDEEAGKVRLDVRQIIALQLLELGLNAEQFAIAPHCTYQEPERFFSYRRTREKKVQWSGIVSRS